MLRNRPTPSPALLSPCARDAIDAFDPRAARDSKAPRTAARQLFVIGAAVLILLAGFAATASAAPKRTALVIGNANYSQIPSLKNPVNDASDIAAKLRDLGFEVTSASDLDKRGMEKEIRSFGRRIRASKGDAVFYYAGHGVERDGRNYLIPLRADIHDPEDLPYKAVDVGQLLTQLESAKNGVNIIILDACRNNPYEHFRGIAVSGLASLTGPTGSLIAFSTSPGNVAADGKGRNGVFTKHLLEAMSIPGATLDETFQRVRRDVARETGKSQIPWSNSSVIGDFFFTQPGAEPTGGSRTPPAESASSSYSTSESEPESSSGSQFQSQGNDQYLDTKNKLLWYCPDNRDVYTHKSAEKTARDFGAVGANWRLPTDREFKTAIAEGAVGNIDGFKDDGFTRYWIAGKVIWLGEGQVARITDAQSVRLEKQSLSGNHRACFVKSGY